MTSTLVAATRTHHQESGGFRPEVQALRAAAVTAVVLYHLWPDWLPGGFVGVDVFFVISGYLITRQLFGELRATGRISLVGFWARRIRRLLPAALFVLAISLLVLVTLMPRVVWTENLREIAAASVYLENWLLGNHAIDYLAADDTPSLAQHYWSLSVEEQFYALWPLLLFAAVALTRRLRIGYPDNRARTSALWALGLVGAASLGFSMILTAARPAYAFFATTTRAWEFAVGGLVALWPVVPVALRAPGVRRMVSRAGWVVIAGSCVVVTGALPFPGWVAVVPVAGVALVLASGTSGRFVERPVVQWVGDHSYSIYLWHWPPIVAAPWVLNGPAGFRTKLVILGATVVLAFITKRFIEDPVRTGAWWRTSPWKAYALAGVGAVLVMGAASVLLAGVQRSNDAASAQLVASQGPCVGASAMVNRCNRPYERPSDRLVTFAAADTPPGTDGCQQAPDHRGAPAFCEFGAEHPNHTVALVGNSYAVQFVPALEAYGDKRGWRIILAARTDCMGLSIEPVVGQSPDDPCVAWSKAVQDHLLDGRRLDAVVFAAHENSQVYLAGENATDAVVDEARDHVTDSWSRFENAGVAVMVVKHIPGTRPDPAPECVAMSDSDYDPCSRGQTDVTVTDMMSRLAEQTPGVQFESLDRFFCEAGLCHTAIGGMLAYYDDHHVSAAYARTLSPFLGADIERLFG